MKHASVVRPARILVIEDNASDVYLLDLALKKQDLRYELVHVPTGGEALAFVRRRGIHAQAPIPDLILVDLNLPKYTGEEHRARDPKRQTSRRRSSVRMEFFPVPARPGPAQ